jgi:hypothetical protein
MIGFGVVPARFLVEKIPRGRREVVENDLTSQV